MYFPDFISLSASIKWAFIYAHIASCARINKRAARGVRRSKKRHTNLFIFHYDSQCLVSVEMLFMSVHLELDSCFYAFCDCTFTKWIVYKLLEFEMKDDGEQFNVPCRVREFIFYYENATVGSELFLDERAAMHWNWSSREIANIHKTWRDGLLFLFSVMFWGCKSISCCPFGYESWMREMLKRLTDMTIE